MSKFEFYVCVAGIVIIAACVVRIALCLNGMFS